MRYSIPVKFIAILLCALALALACGCVLGIVQVAELGLYTDGFDSWVENRLEWEANSLAKNLTDRYAVRSLTNCPDAVLEELGYWYVFEDSIHWTGLEQESYGFVIQDPQGVVLAEHSLPEGKSGTAYQVACKVQYPVQVTDQDAIDAAYGTEYLRREVVQLGAYDHKPVSIRYYESPLYQVDILLDAEAVMNRSGTSLELIEIVCTHRYTMIVLLVVALALVAMSLVYLCYAAGKSTSQDISNPNGLNRLPLDLYLLGGGAAGVGLYILAKQLVNHWIFGVDNLNPGTLTLVGVVVLCIALIIVGFLFAFAAQVKRRDAFWWSNTLIGRCGKKLWKPICNGFAVLCKLISMMPLLYKFLLTAVVMLALPLLFGYFVVEGKAFALPLFILSLIADGAVVAYAAYAYGTLIRGAERMAEGELLTTINTKYLVGVYRKCAVHLNALADVAVEAAKNQMRSERMKTELITNVSHDIKTPLTSIINYVDILRSARTAQEQVQYLEVLGRQSQRLKKLIEDLVEMSKASSGNMTVDIIKMDPVETVNQALGEFADKLERAELTTVFQKPEQPLSFYADGRLTWRVLSNLLSNIVKYAMPGTRVYIQVQQVKEQMEISLKNISREPLNVSADELTERFVRGDLSRNTEGSGLGLNIAKSLMELQKGHLQLLVDGDLFKVTLTFPMAQ